MFDQLLGLGLRGMSGGLVDGLPGFLGITVAIENGYLSLSQRLEAFQLKVYKRRRLGPMMSQMGADEEPEPESEMKTVHRVKWVVTYCADLDAVRQATEVAKAELEKIRAWRRDRRGREEGLGDYVACG